MSVDVARTAVLVVFLAVIIATDLTRSRIPNAATFPAMVVGLGLAALESVPGGLFERGLADHAAALASAFVLSFPLYAVGAMKAGDVKLLMAIGALMGTAFLFNAAVYGALLGGLFAVVYIAVQRLARGRPLREALRSFMPYGVALGLGAFVALFVRR